MPRTPRHQIVDLTDEVSVSPYATLDSADHQLIDELHETLGLEIMEANIERVVYAVLEADARHSHQIEVGRRDFLPRFDMVRAVYNRNLAIAEQGEDLVVAERHRSEIPGLLPILPVMAILRLAIGIEFECPRMRLWLLYPRDWGSHASSSVYSCSHNKRTYYYAFSAPARLSH